jgi:hypothetical protein
MAYSQFVYLSLYYLLQFMAYPTEMNISLRQLRYLNRKVLTQFKTKYLIKYTRYYILR